MRTKLQSIIGVFKQFNSSNLNSFANTGIYFDDIEFLNVVQTRKFEEDGFILNIEELASLYHLPAVGVETPTDRLGSEPKGRATSNFADRGICSI